MEVKSKQTNNPTCCCCYQATAPKCKHMASLQRNSGNLSLSLNQRFSLTHWLVLKNRGESMTLNKCFFFTFIGQPEDPSWIFLRAETTWPPSGKADNKGSIQFISFCQAATVPTASSSSFTSCAGSDSVAVCCCWLCCVIDSCQPHSSTAAAN